MSFQDGTVEMGYQNLIFSVIGYETIACSRQNNPLQISIHSSSEPVAVLGGEGPVGGRVAGLRSDGEGSHCTGGSQHAMLF